MTESREVWELPHRHIGRRVLCFDTVTSTSDLAATLSADQANAGTAILSREQTAGRGQYGRGWQASPGSSVLLSVILHPPPELRRPAVLTAWAAVSVCETIHKITGLEATIKWPNDVLLQGKKVCGVLIEQGRGVVVGIGLNVNQSAADFEVAGLPLAGSLAAATGQAFDTREIAKFLLLELDREFDLLTRGELTKLEACWKRHLGLIGHEVVAGTFDGVRHRGLLVECAFAGLEIEAAGGDVVTLLPEQVRTLAKSH